MEDRLNSYSAKNEDMTNCENYKGISLLNITYKILINIIHEKLQKYTEYVLGDYQNGFRKRRATPNIYRF